MPSIATIGLSPREIAVSGMRAQRTRMNLIANNLANVMTTRTPEGGAFRRQVAVFKGQQIQPLMNPRRFGVEVSAVRNDPSPLRSVYDPSHPDANDEGYVSYPNVDVSTEMVNLVTAQRAYEANVTVIASGSRIHDAAMEILRA